MSEHVVSDFKGKDGLLIQSIDSLLEMDAKGILVPHGIGGHARTLLRAAKAAIEQAALTVPEGYAVVPKNIHPLYSSGCEKVMQLLANCPSASRFDNPQDYYQYWWELLLAAAPKVKK